LLRVPFSNLDTQPIRFVSMSSRLTQEDWRHSLKDRLQQTTGKNRAKRGSQQSATSATTTTDMSQFEESMEFSENVFYSPKGLKPSESPVKRTPKGRVPRPNSSNNRSTISNQGQEQHNTTALQQQESFQLDSIRSPVPKNSSKRKLTKPATTADEEFQSAALINTRPPTSEPKRSLSKPDKQQKKERRIMSIKETLNMSFSKLDTIVGRKSAKVRTTEERPSDKATNPATRDEQQRDRRSKSKPRRPSRSSSVPRNKDETRTRKRESGTSRKSSSVEPPAERSGTKKSSSVEPPAERSQRRDVKPTKPSSGRERRNSGENRLQDGLSLSEHNVSVRPKHDNKRRGSVNLHKSATEFELWVDDFSKPNNNNHSSSTDLNNSTPSLNFSLSGSNPTRRRPSNSSRRSFNASNGNLSGSFKYTNTEFHDSQTKLNFSNRELAAMKEIDESPTLSPPESRKSRLGAKSPSPLTPASRPRTRAKPHSFPTMPVRVESPAPEKSPTRTPRTLGERRRVARTTSFEAPFTPRSDKLRAVRRASLAAGEPVQPVAEEEVAPKAAAVVIKPLLSAPRRQTNTAPSYATQRRLKAEQERKEQEEKLKKELEDRRKKLAASVVIRSRVPHSYNAGHVDSNSTSMVSPRRLAGSRALRRSTAADHHHNATTRPESAEVNASTSARSTRIEPASDVPSARRTGRLGTSTRVPRKKPVALLPDAPPLDHVDFE
jgi:hypothetical protein